MGKSLKNMQGQRSKQKKNLTSGKLPKGGGELFQNLGFTKRAHKKKVRKLKKIAGRCLDSFIQGLQDERISLSRNQEKNCTENEHSMGNLLNHTVNLCESDSGIDSSNASVILVPLAEVEPKKEPVIDLIEDFPEQNQVVDLTKQNSTPQLVVNANGASEPTVIDISGDESVENPNFKPESDEILVVGTFSKSCNFNNLMNCSDRLKRKYIEKQSVLDKINDKNLCQKRRIHCRSNASSYASQVAKVGENVYVNSPLMLPSDGLRPIIIDGSNVAFVHSNSNFSCKRLEICINYFKEKGHKVTAFVPQFRVNNNRSDDPQLLRKLERQGDVVLTPSKKIDGKNIVPYDDRFIVQTAVLKGGIIVTRDNYNDLLKENPAWAETIKYRTLAFTWVDDVLMFPKDPLGECGPSLEEFLRFH